MWPFILVSPRHANLRRRDLKQIVGQLVDPRLGLGSVYLDDLEIEAHPVAFSVQLAKLGVEVKGQSSSLRVTSALSGTP